MTVHRIVVVDDHPVVLLGARQLIDAESDMTVIGEAQDAASGIRMVGELHPDAVVLDLHLGDNASPDVCREMLAASPTTRVLLHTAYEQIEPLRACLRSGAAGVVFKDASLLVTALRTVLVGEEYVDPRAIEPSREPMGVPDSDELVERLTPREYEVLCGFAVGKSTREVASSLNLTENTVHSYTKSLLTKLGANSRLQALATARRIGILP